MCRCQYSYRSRYGFFDAVADIVMTILTAGLWLVWIFIREMRGQR